MIDKEADVLLQCLQYINQKQYFLTEMEESSEESDSESSSSSDSSDDSSDSSDDSSSSDENENKEEHVDENVLIEKEESDLIETEQEEINKLLDY